MPALQAVLEALSSRLATIQGLRTFAYVPDLISPPCAIVQLPRTIDFDLVYGRGADTYTIPVMALVGKGDDRSSHSKLASYLNPDGPTSFKGVLEADPSLGNLVDDVRVLRADGVGAYTFGGVEYAGALFTVAVTG